MKGGGAVFTRIVKNVNESRIARLFAGQGAFTKQEIARAAGLSFPTAGRIVDGFVARGMVRDLGPDPQAAGGRRPRRYRIDPGFASALLLFLDGERCCCRVIDAVGQTVASFTRAVGPAGYLAAVRAVVAQTAARTPGLASVAVGVPGGVAGGRILYIDGYDELDGCDLKGLLEREFGLETAVENNMRAVVYGLAAREGLLQEETVVCLQIAENGPGCGVLVNGRPLSGFAGLVGEVGYLPAEGRGNLQQIALAGFPDGDVTGCFARILTSACVFLNPRRITVYRNPWVEDAALLRARCGEYLPPAALPEIVLSPDYEADFMAGLARLALNALYPSYEIVRNQEVLP